MLKLHWHPTELANEFYTAVGRIECALEKKIIYGRCQEGVRR